MLTLSTSSANSDKSLTLVSYSTTKGELLWKSSGDGCSIWFFSLKWGYFSRVRLNILRLVHCFLLFPIPHPCLEKMLTPLTVIVTVRGVRRDPFFRKRMLDSS